MRRWRTSRTPPPSRSERRDRRFRGPDEAIDGWWRDILATISVGTLKQTTFRADHWSVDSLRHALLRLVPPTLLALVLAGLLAHPGGAGASVPRFPKPNCGWASAARVSQAIADPVRGLSPVWSERFAPILTCRYVERQARAQVAGEPIVGVEFLENQDFSTRGLTPVAHLGSCDPHAQCPGPGEPAWRLVRNGDTTGSGVGGASGSPSYVQYRVQDDLDAIIVTVDNPAGALRVSNESAAVERLVRSLLGRFRWDG